MAFTYSTTAAPQESSMLRGNVALVAGHWTTTLGTAQAIVTGGTDVLWGMAQQSSTVDGIVAVTLNANAAGTGTDGTMQIIPGKPSSDGTWCAIVRVSGTVGLNES